MLNKYLMNIGLKEHQIISLLRAPTFLGLVLPTTTIKIFPANFSLLQPKAVPFYSVTPHKVTDSMLH
jgi:hypothetical protein